MNAEDEQQGAIWELLYEQVGEVLRGYGVENYLGAADYWVLDDNYGFKSINIALHKLSMLQQTLIASLQSLLSFYPDWEIKVSIDIPGKEKSWPEMGLIIRAREIVDQLQRQFLPEELKEVRF